MKRGYDYAMKHNVAPLGKMIGPYAPKAPRTLKTITPLHLLLATLLGIIIGCALALSLASPDTVRRIQAKEGMMVQGFNATSTWHL
jgi:hypothetical protein